MNLKKYIESNNINCSIVARLIPCAPQWISQIVSGKRTPSYKMARRIEQITGGEVSRKHWYPDD